LLGKLAVGFWLLRLTAKNFDRYALGERPEST